MWWLAEVVKYSSLIGEGTGEVEVLFRRGGEVEGY
jgi:hypothetical protein